jgi:hypothetical protein
MGFVGDQEKKIVRFYEVYGDELSDLTLSISDSEIVDFAILEN